MRRHGLDVAGDTLCFGSTTGNVYLSEGRGETWVNPRQQLSAGVLGAFRLSHDMVTVRFTRHLYRYFPMLEGHEIRRSAGSVAEVPRGVDALAPGFTDYVLDERGALRRRVTVSIDDTVVIDRRTLSDRVPEGGTLYVFQALSGG